jgi:hypothetical protein
MNKTLAVAALLSAFAATSFAQGPAPIEKATAASPAASGAKMKHKKHVKADKAAPAAPAASGAMK